MNSKCLVRKWLSDLRLFFFSLIISLFSFSVFAHSIAGFDIPLSICVHETVTFLDTSFIDQGDTVTYSWSFEGAIYETSELQNPTSTWMTPGVKTIKLTIFLQDGDSSSAIKQVVVNELPVADFSWDEACANSPTYFTRTGSVPDGAIGASYFWNFDDQEYSTEENATKQYDTVGSKLVKLIITSGKGCKDSVTKSVSILEKPIVNFSSPESCDGDTVHFVNHSQRTDLRYVWKFGDGVLDSSYHAKHVYAFAGDYNVVLKAYLEGGCTSEVVIQKTISPIPSASFNVIRTGRTIQCDGPSGNDIYGWTFGDFGKSTIEDPSFTFPEDFGALEVCLVTKRGQCTNQECQDIGFHISVENIAKAEIELSQNPTSGLFTVQLGYGPWNKVEVVDLRGSVIFSQVDLQSNSELQVNLRNKVNGLYLVRIIGDDYSLVKRVIKI